MRASSELRPLRRPGPGSLRLAALIGLFASIALPLAGTLWPFRFDLHPASIARKWSEVEWVFFYRNGDSGLAGILIDRDLLLNLVLLAPMGFALAAVGRPRPVWRATLGAAALGLVLSATIEALQILTPERVSQLADVWRNTLGSLVGGAVGAWAQEGLRALRSVGPLQPKTQTGQTDRCSSGARERGASPRTGPRGQRAR